MFGKMNKKYLIACGDSFTKGHTLGEKGSWAYHVAKKMNLNLINLSANGMGNEWVASQLLSFLYRHESIVDELVVMIGWTDFARELNFYTDIDSNYIQQIITVPADIHSNENNSHRPDHFFKKIINNRKVLKNFIGNEVVCLYKTYFSILHTQVFLEKNNIPFLFFDSVANNKLYYNQKIPYILSTSGEQIDLDFSNTDVPFLQDFKDKTFSDKIFNNKYISFEGNTIFEWISKPGNQKYEEGNPGHTNELGANVISDMIIKEYDKLYN
jgi:hypothetical protein